MEDSLTPELIRAAQAGDDMAVETVIRAMESRIQTIAAAEARHMVGDQVEYAEEFAQAGRIGVYEALGRFDGETVDSFYGFMHRTAWSAVKDEASRERNIGADHDALKVFAHWVKRCDGDVALAERMCQTVPPEGGKRLGRDRAHAARLAWQSTISLDAPISDENLHGSSYSPSGGGNNVMQGADRLVSTYGVPEDLITPEDVSAEERRQNVAAVRAILDTMGEQTANVLRGSFGISPMMFFGYQRGDNGDAELAAELGMTEKQVKTGRSKGFLAFAKRWVPFIADGNAEAAQGWWDAYQAERDRFRRPTTA